MGIFRLAPPQPHSSPLLAQFCLIPIYETTLPALAGAAGSSNGQETLPPIMSVLPKWLPTVLCTPSAAILQQGPCPPMLQNPPQYDPILQQTYIEPLTTFLKKKKEEKLPSYGATSGKTE